MGQPEFSVDAALVFFPYKGQLLVRTDVAKLDITEEAYRRYYSKRFDVYGSSKSVSTRIHERLEIAESLDFTAPLEDDANESDQHEPTIATLMEPEELPNELQPSNRTRTRRNWEHLPPPRVTRSRGDLQIHSCKVRYNRVVAQTVTGLAMTKNVCTSSPFSSRPDPRWFVPPLRDFNIYVIMRLRERLSRRFTSRRLRYLALTSHEQVQLRDIKTTLIFIAYLKNEAVEEGDHDTVANLQDLDDPFAAKYVLIKYLI